MLTLPKHLQTLVLTLLAGLAGLIQPYPARAERADLDELRNCALRDAACTRTATVNLARAIAAREMEAEKDSVVVNSQWLDTLSDLFSASEWQTEMQTFAALPHSAKFMENMAEWLPRRREQAPEIYPKDFAGDLSPDESMREIEENFTNDPMGPYGWGYNLEKYAWHIARMIEQADPGASKAYGEYASFRNPFLQFSPGQAYYPDQGDIALARVLHEVRGCVPTDAQVSTWRAHLETYTGEYDPLHMDSEKPRETVRTLAELTALLIAAKGKPVPATPSAECLFLE
jgi:hypothetical protein